MVRKHRLRKFFKKKKIKKKIKTFFFDFFFQICFFFLLLYFFFACSPVSRSFTCIALVPKWTWSQLCDVLTSLFCFFKCLKWTRSQLCDVSYVLVFFYSSSSSFSNCPQRTFLAATCSYVIPTFRLWVSLWVCEFESLWVCELRRNVPKNCFLL